MFGYMGKILRVNLTKGEITEQPLDMSIAKDYIGGAGYAARLLFEEVPASADPLGPENKLIFMTGPLTGTAFPTTARYEVVAKSPLTGIYGEASSSGFWGATFKRTGYDGIIFEGESPKPVYLSVTNDKAELKDASHLWGQDATEVQLSVKEELRDKRANVACIGPAGEKQVLLACVMNDEGRAAGRCGLGAVMGSKNLKAVAVSGNKRVEVADRNLFQQTVKDVTAAVHASPLIGALSKWGTASSMDTGWLSGDVPVQNWRKGLWKEGCINLGGKKMADTILQPHEACWSCPIRCARWIKIESGPYAMEGPGPEYETLGTFGTMLLNDNLEAVCWANDLCNRYGIDTISTGATIAWAMEAYEKGVITKQDTGGIELTWGNVDAILEMTKLIGEKKGIGELLGQGTKRASAKLGKGSEAYGVHVKGLEAPMHDPRGFFSMAVNYATSPRGACHLHGMPYVYELGLTAPEAGIPYRQTRFDRDGKGLATKASQDLFALYDSLVVCNFVGLGLSPFHMSAILGIVAGMPISSQEVLKAGERIVNLQRLYNLACGVTAADDKLPPRLLEPTDEGGHAGKVPDVAHQLAEYYQVRGWDAQGVPTPEKLAALGLEWASAAAS